MGIEPSDGGEIQGPVPERPISANPGLNFFFPILYLPSYALLGVSFCVIITVSKSKGVIILLCTIELYGLRQGNRD